MSDWKPISSAPKDGTEFFALNHDGEIYVAKFTDEPPRLVFRTHGLREERAYRHHQFNGVKMLEPINQPWREVWEDVWTLWTRGYDFTPTHWMPLPSPPKDEPK